MIIYKKDFLLIFFFSILFFFNKWFFSFYFYDEDLSIRIIFEQISDGYLYFAHLEALSNLNFNNSFDPNIKNLNNLPVPIGAIFFHSIFKLLFGNISVILLEFIFTFLFFLLFFLISNKFGLKGNHSLLVPIVFFSVPSFFSLIEIDYIQYLTNIMNNFYNLRFPIPMVTNLYFFVFVFYLLYLVDKNIFKIKNFIILGIICALTLSSYYYFFIIEIITLIIFLIWKTKYKFPDLISKNIKYYIVFFLTLTFLSIPFFFILTTSENDYGLRIYIIDLNLEKKKILITYILNKLIELKFLLIFSSICFINFFYFTKKKQNHEYFNILFIIFIASILSPLVFIIFSTKVSLVYHFTNIILLTIYLFLFFFIFDQIKFLFENRIASFLLIIILSSIFIANNYFVYKKNYNNNYESNYRNSFNKVIKEINNYKTKKQDLSLLTFDQKLMVWSIMNDVQNIELLSAVLTPKKNYMIENDLIDAFKLLNLNAYDYLNFFKNKKQNWRYLNKYTQQFFWGTYSASSLGTYKNSKDFDKETLKFIKNTSPLYVQSLVIPNSEFDRFEEKFLSRIYKETNNIDLIIISKRNPLYEKISYINNNYELKEINGDFKFFYKKNK